MITNIHRAKTASDIRNYVRYSLAPKENKDNKHYKAGERVLDFDTQYVNLGVDIEHNITSHDVTNQIMDWNKSHRNEKGKKPPACPALLGEISFTKEDSEKFYATSFNGTRYLDHKKILAIAKQSIGMTMSEDRPMFLSLHGDTECLHVHFAVSIVDSHGKIWDGSRMTNDQGEKISVRDFRQWEITNEKLEIEHGLDRVEHRKAFEHEGEHRQRQTKRPSNAAVHLANKLELTPTLDLAGRLDIMHAKSNGSFDRFLELAEEQGVRIKPNMNETKVNGLSFACGDMDGYIKASKLGNKYKWAKLSEKLHYEYDRDYQKLADIKAGRTPNIERASTIESAASQLDGEAIDQRPVRKTRRDDIVLHQSGAEIVDSGYRFNTEQTDRDGRWTTNQTREVRDTSHESTTTTTAASPDNSGEVPVDTYWSQPGWDIPSGNSDPRPNTTTTVQRLGDEGRTDSEEITEFELPDELAPSDNTNYAAALLDAKDRSYQERRHKLLTKPIYPEQLSNDLARRAVIKDMFGLEGEEAKLVEEQLENIAYLASKDGKDAAATSKLMQVDIRKLRNLHDIAKLNEQFGANSVAEEAKKFNPSQGAKIEGSIKNVESKLTEKRLAEIVNEIEKPVKD